MKSIHGFRVFSLACAGLLVPLLLTAPAEAKGCIKGAIVGGVAGHLVGHGKMGAVAGCAVGHHNANKRDDAEEQRSQNQQTRPR
ncbi:MAG: hypothetical protein JWM36_3146 [Hyphomicrobiales bacterium]|nr:hypothetical protein [Hyphomicrobiales bacterium]